MKTLNSIIDQSIKNNIDSIDICNDLIVSSTENPNLYDGVVSLAENIVEDLIRTNFKYLISLAYDNYEDTEISEEVFEQVEVNTDISEEDEQMLRFIAG